MLNRPLAAAVLSALLLIATPFLAQSADMAPGSLSWDVVSVKPMSKASCPPNGGGIRYLPNGLSAACVAPVFVVEIAYRLMDQTRISGLPGWAEGSELFAIDVRVSGEDVSAYGKLTRDDKFRMLQPVLAERFHMKAHMEPKEMSVYALVTTKGGEKLKQPAPNELATSQWLAPDGKVKWSNAPLANLLWLLGAEVGRPIVDETGLAGKYDFTLEFSPAAHAREEDANRPSVFTALEEQLGLKLVPSWEPVNILVIDSIEQPTPN